jgi:hypothetical protein
MSFGHAGGYGMGPSMDGFSGGSGYIHVPDLTIHPVSNRDVATWRSVVAGAGLMLGAAVIVLLTVV